mgnify:CR=1 FL=1
MISDIIVYISTYINDNDFQEGICYISYRKIQERRRYINRKKCAFMLYNCIKEPLGLEYPRDKEFLKEMLNNAKNEFTFQELFLYIGNSLLGDKYSVYDYTDNYYKRKHMMNIDYVSHGLFYNGLKLNNDYRVYRNKPVCATYRLSFCKKRYLIKHTPIAKALIY